jgi:predicted RNA binding protein YcfA (HicA-like mRNA interferase family)
VKVLQRLGFEVDRQSGSHIIIKRGRLRVIVPKQKVIKPGTLRNIVSQAGLTIDEFKDLL